jgi:hypothetical protein
MVIAITVLSLLLAGATIIVVFGFKAVERLTDEIKYQEQIIEAKNDALKYYVDAYQEQLEKILDLRHELNMIREANADSLRYAPKKPGRPKGSKNKVQKPKFDKVKFNEKYGK